MSMFKLLKKPNPASGSGPSKRSKGTLWRQQLDATPIHNPKPVEADLRRAESYRPIFEPVDRSTQRQESVVSAGAARPQLLIGDKDGVLEKKADQAAMHAILSSGQSTSTSDLGVGPAETDARLHADGGRVAEGIMAERQSGGSRLPSGIAEEFGRQFGNDLSPVRIHQGQRVDVLADDLGANAFTTGCDLFFRRGAFQPDTIPGRRRLGHELAHVVQQQRAPRRPGLLPIQREMRFDRNAAEARAKVVGGGEADRASDTVFNTFVAGLEKHLGLTCEIAPSSYKITSVSDSSMVSSIRQKFVDTYANGLELRGPDGGFRTVDGEAAKQAWENIRKMVRDQVGKGVDVITSNLIAGPAAADDKLIHVRPSAVAETYFRADSGWDMFWVILHEMLHIGGYEDRKETEKGYVNLVPYTKTQRDITMFGKPEYRKVTVLGDVVYELNVIRAGLELPVRTNYSDPSPSHEEQPGVFFADSPGRNQKEYVGGMVMSADASAEHNKMRRSDLYLDKAGGLSADERHRQKGREEGKSFAPGFDVSEFTFRNGKTDYSPPYAISVDVSDSGDVNLVGDYFYSVDGRERRGVLSTGEFVYDGAYFGLKFAWQELGKSNDGDWERWGAAELTIDTASDEYGNLKSEWAQPAELKGDWATEDGGKVAGNKMSMVVKPIKK